MAKGFLVGVAGLVTGGLIVGLAFVNPAGWMWLSDVTGRGMDQGMPRAEADNRERDVLYWRAPMDPSFVSDSPGTSPMGMDLVPVYANDGENLPAGTVRIDPTFVQNIGVRTDLVERRDIAMRIRTVGTLAHNDQQISWVNTKYEGWIENVAVNYVGETVEKGQVLFDIFSPQLVTTQNEYLQSVDYAARLDTSAYPEIAARAHSLVASARQRLRFWDIPDGQIDALERDRNPRRTLSVVSPVAGVVVAKMDQALDGMYVRPGMNIYKIADLTTIWVDVEIFENQVASMQVGQRATVELPYQLGRTFAGAVRYLYPHFNEQTRTMTVSIELQNPDQTLRAEMYANVTFDVPAAENVLAVPEEAVIRSGTRDLVVIQQAPGTFRVVPVVLGVNGSGVWEVLEGVAEGDRVVVSAQFLIDSESNLRDAVRRIDTTDADETPVSTTTEDLGEVAMLAKIIDWSIANRFLVILGTVATVLGGMYAVRAIPLDALPDLSDVQVIVFTDYPGQAPQVVEDQVTYPITTQMLAVPFAKVVRGYSFFGVSFVYVIFEDGTDLYWARSRVLEYLNYVSGRLPQGVTPTLGPDATGVGWAFMYALRSDTQDLAQLRSLQDWFLKYELTAIPGVSEVASVGGFVRQYQITVDPNKLRAYNMPLSRIGMAVRRSNNDVGGRVLEMAETEFMVRGEGYIRGLDDVKQVALGVDRSGTPISVQDVATVQFGPDIRRGLAELNGEGEVVGGIVIARYGADTYDVIERIKARLEELQPGLPEGVEVVPVYDRTALIDRSISTLQEKLVQQFLIVALVCIVFLLHVRSAMVAILTLPVAILMAFIAIYLQGANANIMSLGGIAIAIGAMVDGAIVMVENAHKHLERDHDTKPRWQIIGESAKEVGPTLFFALVVSTVSFAPIFALEAQEGRLFKPLALTWTYSMAAAALLSLTLVPVLLGYWVRGRIRPEEANPITRGLAWVYTPILRGVLRWRWLVVGASVVAMLATWLPISRLGSEFMPPLWEGDLLYMPTMFPGVSIGKAREVLQQTDRIIKTFPEVEQVFGKVGRADTATDPAPLSMIETTITLKPRDQWRPGMTPDRLTEEMNQAIQFPGLTNAWTMPIKTRIDMLSTGIKTPVGIKLSGPDLNVLQELGQEVEAVVRNVPGTLSVYAERVMGGNYLNFSIRRDQIARYGLTVGDVQDVIQSAIGGMNITTTVEGLERYPVNLRYSRELRDTLPALRDILVQTPTQQQIPLGQLARLSIDKGPPAIKSEQARPNAWIYVDIQDVDVGSYVRDAQQAVAENVEIPTGYSMRWSGQYEYMVRAQERMQLIVPLTLLIIFLIIYLNTRAVGTTLIVLLAVPLSLVGSFWLLYFLDYNMSVAIWVGVIALAGLSAETGVVMLLYLDVACEDARQAGRLVSKQDLMTAISGGAAKRIRPVIMLSASTVVGLLPIMWSQGTGADVMKRIAAPMVGGLVTAVGVVLLVFPAIYYIWRARGLEDVSET